MGAKYKSILDDTCLLPKKGYSYFDAPSLDVSLSSKVFTYELNLLGVAFSMTLKSPPHHNISS